MGSKNLKGSALALSGAIAAAVPAVAQEAVSTQGSSSGLEEIIVTARKRAEPIQSVPVSITAFSATDLHERNITTLDRVGSFTPGLTFEPGARTGGGGAAATVYIRGIGQNDYAVLSDPGVGIYVDGVYLGRTTGSILDVIDVDHVEVLRGPQGTLFGKNTIGGAVTVTSALPGHVFRGYAQLEAGDYGDYGARAAVDVPVSDDLAVKFSVSDRNRDGYGRSLITHQPMSDVHSLSGRAVVSWTPFDDLKVVYVVDGTEQRELGQFTKLVAVNPVALNAGLGSVPNLSGMIL